MRKLFALLLVMLLAVSVSAQTPFVVDDGDLLNLTELESLENEFSQLHAEYGYTIAVATVESLDGKTAAGAAADCYKTSGYGNDGILLLICEDEGQWYIYTSGICAQVIPDSDVAKIGAAMMDDLQSDNYGKAIQTFAEMSAEPVCRELDAQNAAAEKMQKNNGWFAVLGMIGGLAVGIVVVWLLTKRKSVKPTRERRKPAPAADSQDSDS